MRTNIVLDDKIVAEAFRYAGVTTKRELVHVALCEYVESHRRRDLRLLRGRVQLFETYDYKALRPRTR